MNRGWTIAVIAAIAGVFVLGSVGAVFGGLAIVDDYETDHDKTVPTGTREGYYAFTDIRAGDCALNWADDDWGTELVPCTEDYEYEFFASVDLEPGKWPGQESIDLRAERECEKHLSKRLGRPYDFDEDYYEYLSPVEEAWPEDRHVVCMVLAPDTKHTE